MKCRIGVAPYGRKSSLYSLYGLDKVSPRKLLEEKYKEHRQEYETKWGFENAKCLNSTQAIEDNL